MLMPLPFPAPHPSMKKSLNYSDIEVFKKKSFKISSGSSHSIFFIFMTKYVLFYNSPIEIKKIFL